MFRRVFNILIVIPIALVVLGFMIANRQGTTISLDPLNASAPALSFELPVYVLVFASFILGMVFGSIYIWFKQGKHRKNARKQGREASKWQKAATQEKHRADELDPSVKNDTPPALAKLSQF